MFDLMIFRIKAKLKGARIHRTATIENPNKIEIGRNCIIDAYSVLRVGKGNNSKLIIGDDVVIKRGAYITVENSQVLINSHAMIGHDVWIGGKGGNIEIGRNTMIAVKTVIVSSNHDYLDIQVPYHEGHELAEDIRIGENVWIGSLCVVLPGVKIGDGSVVGALSIVTKDVDRNSLIVGNPARLIKEIVRDGEHKETRNPIKYDYERPREIAS